MTTMPAGWASTTLGDLMVARAGSVNPAQFPDEEFDLYSIPAHDRGGFDVVRGSEIGSSKRLVSPGDVMVSKIVPHIRRARIVDAAGPRRQISSTEWISFRSPHHDPKFLRYFLTSDGFHEQFMATVSGVGGSLMRAQPARVKPIGVPVPPRDEQHRIVEILEDHLSRLDAAEASLARNLVRAKRLSAGICDAMVWGGGYETTAIADLLRERMRNGHSARAVASGEQGVRTLTLTAVTMGSFADEYTKITSADPAKVSDLWLKAGDIFVQRANTPELVGTAALYDGPDDWAIFPDLLIRLRVDASRVRPGFAALALQTERAHRSLRARAKGLAGSMPKVDQGAIGETVIPLPPLDVQDRVLIQVHDAQASVGALTRELARANHRARALRRSLLTAAFAGRLTRTVSGLDRPAGLMEGDA